ncbi:unnamed protein product [Brassica napus]|uniref:(rape) hypothetical protein n=1 Tax=Brassica napus TaxID=3708 RepID=A0A816KNI2_BRANA|nr:unnamed protein product [Brassica napus]
MLLLVEVEDISTPVQCKSFFSSSRRTMEPSHQDHMLPNRMPYLSY